REVVCPEIEQIPVFMLNLKRRVDRLQSSSAVLEKELPWLQVCRVSAFDGRNLSTVPLSDRLVQPPVLQSAIENDDFTRGGRLTTGAVACALGHAVMWEHIAQEDFPFALLMEDDLSQVHPDLVNFMCKLATGGFPEDWEIIQLDFDLVTGERKEAVFEAGLSSKLNLVSGSAYNYGMYLLRKTAAQKLLQLQLPIGQSCSLQIDDPSCPMRKALKAYRTDVPAALFAASRENDTDIQQLHFLQVDEPLPDCPPLDALKMQALDGSKIHRFEGTSLADALPVELIELRLCGAPSLRERLLSAARLVPVRLSVTRDHIEEAWLFNWDRTRRGQALHLDNFHHFQFPKRVATVIVRLRDDPVGIGFPLATWPGMHELAQDDELVAKLNEEGNTLPWRGNGQGRSFKSHGYLDEAFQEVCRDAPLKLRQGDGLLYYHLRQNGEVNLRSMHGSCSTEDASEPKIFMAKFVRGGSLLSTFGSLRTPELLAELRAWMDTRQRESGLDAAAIWMSGTEHGLLEPTGCQKQPRTLGSPWFVRPEADAKNPTMLCAPPSQFQRRRAGEVFEIHIMIGNTGAQPWPSNTVLSLRDGDPMGGPAGLRLPEVPVGSTVPLSWQLTAPESGKVFSVWSLADGDRAPFGPLLWVDAVIEEQEKSSSAEQRQAAAEHGGEIAVDPEPEIQPACEAFWSQPIFQELSSQVSTLPSLSEVDRGRPRLCWSLGHRFWFGELSFHHVSPPETYIFGFCVPKSCNVSSDVDLQIAKPFLRRLLAHSSGSNWCRLELQEWTAEAPQFEVWLLVCALLYFCLPVAAFGEERRSRAACSWLRLVATVALVVYHMSSFPIYAKPGLPPGLLHLCTWLCGILHDPLFTALSASLLLRGGPHCWNVYLLPGRLLRKWARQLLPGLAARSILCYGLASYPTVPFLLKVQPPKSKLCHEEALRCTHHSCTPLWGLADHLLAFPPLDYAGNFVEQDMVRSALLILVACCLEGDLRLFRFLALLGLAWFCWPLGRSLSTCVLDGRVHGPCVPSPFTAYLDLPGDNVVALAVLLWHLTRSKWPKMLALPSFLAAVAMEVMGCPWQGVGPLWYCCSRVLLGLSVAQLTGDTGESSQEAQQKQVPVSPWLWKADRLCFGVCVVHMRVIEVLFGYLRPQLTDFSWQSFVMDVVVVLFGSFLLAMPLLLVTRVPEALLGLWTRSAPVTPRTTDKSCQDTAGDDFAEMVMLKNLPECFTRARMLHILRREGFDCLFNFLYVPLCFQEKRSLCYAFVNFIDHSSAKRFCQTFHGFRAWGVPSESVGEVCFCERHQGLEGIIRYYRNNSVMHSSVPDECKPILLLGTQRVPFPMPVKKIKLPKKLKNEDHVRGSSSGSWG
ncbi:Protein MEI2-like 4 (OML4) (MEI2-like protein 4), partial [Durusdinium trenchii]